MNNSLKVFAYNGSPIQFDLIDGQLMANATTMCQAFGKAPKDWLRTNQTQRYITAISARLKCLPIDLQTYTH